MKKLVALLLVLCLAFSLTAVSSAATYTPGTYEGSGTGYGPTKPVTVKVTVDENSITAVEIAGDEEEPFGKPQFEAYAQAVIDKQSADIDAVAGATMTRNGIKEAVGNALALARGEKKAEGGEIAFTAGEYEATAAGYNGNVTMKVTFSDKALTGIEVVSSVETAHVGDLAYDIMIPEMLEANGSGVDGVSGATFTSRALRSIVNEAAEKAGCTNLDAFKANKVEHKAEDPIEESYDVVVIGAGGAGIAAAAQATQNGNSVLVIEKNAQVGGNTLVSGGQFQSVMPYLVWDPENPDAETGVYARDGQTYNKVKSVKGCINELKMILDWNEAPFDEEYYKTNEFVAGDAAELSKHGVHAEYLPVLKELKAEIKAYLDWAEPKLAAGADESTLTLFSTKNLHIFQTYYGGLRQSADKTQWIYGDINLVKQFIEDGQGLKEWLEDMGAHFIEDTQPTLIGALWYRENEYLPQDGNWGTYFTGPVSVIAAGENNKFMLRTTATDLIVEDGRVTGVKAVRYDGTEITAKATKGVILATGGYAANIDLVLKNNIYWDTAYLTTSTKTTNRNSLQGDGITMAEAVGAATTGMGFTQLMPISWVDNGNLAFGGGNYACWINPTTGKRFVDEGSERDVLSLAEFKNGIVKNNTPGVFVEIYNAEQKIPGPPTAQLLPEDYPGRYYHVKGTVEAFTELFKDPEFAGVTADPAVVLETVKNYDLAVMGKGEFPDTGKAIASRTIGNCAKNEDGSYNADSYDLEGADLIVRLMAPSTHHTMGGVVVDTKRHVLDQSGNIIPGLFAAGEVTGGIHGGNRLGGNAIVEIFVSGRTAANTIAEEGK